LEIFVIFIAVVPGFVEETFFRGFMQRAPGALVPRGGYPRRYFRTGP
jgi:hypothetical protein